MLPSGLVGFIPTYAERGLTFLTHLSAGNQSLGDCQRPPSPWAPLQQAVKVWHQGQLGGEEAHSPSGAFCLTHHFPLRPGTPCRPWGHPSWVPGPWAAAGLCGLLIPLPAGRLEDWVQTPAQPLPACVMFRKLNPGLFTCLVGQGRCALCTEDL